MHNDIPDELAKIQTGIDAAMSALEVLRDRQAAQQQQLDQIEAKIDEALSILKPGPPVASHITLKGK